MGGNPDKSGSIVAKRLIDACKEFKLTIDIVLLKSVLGSCRLTPAQEELIAETDQDGSGFIDVRQHNVIYMRTLLLIQVQYDEFSLMLND